MSVQNYFDILAEKLQACRETQSENIKKAAEMIVDSQLKGGNFYVFGTGHSHMIAEELYTRAGGLAFVKIILPPELMLHQMVDKSTQLERLPGYAKVILDLYPIDERDVVMIISNSGRNSVPVEVAMEFKAKGAQVIAITSMRHSSQVTSRQKDGKKLYEVADLVLDNQAVFGDAAYTPEGYDKPVAGTSDFIGIAIVQTMVVAIVERMLELGEEPPVFLSANIDGSAEKNLKWALKYNLREPR